MEPAERLAAFLADELPADERQALEAELARDAHLRAQLEAMRRADEALTGVAPSVLPAGARDRLLAALQPTFDAELGGSAATDQLAARRRAGSRRTWLTAAGGVAAAVAAVAVLGPALGGLGSGDDAAMSADDAETAETFAAEDGGAASTEEDAGAGAFAPVGPTLLGSGRSLDEEDATELLAAGEVEAVVAQSLSEDEARSLGAAWAAAFGSDPAPLSAYDLEHDGAATADSDEPAAGEGEAETAAEPEAADDASRETSQRMRAADGAPLDADLQILGDVDEGAREDVGRCLGTLLEAGGVVVPVLAELVTYGGEPAIAYALVGVAPDGTVSRPEVWVVSRESCETRYLRQG